MMAWNGFIWLKIKLCRVVVNKVTNHRAPYNSGEFVDWVGDSSTLFHVIGIGFSKRRGARLRFLGGPLKFIVHREEEEVLIFWYINVKSG